MMDMWISHLCRVNEAKAKSLFASCRRSTSFASTWLDDEQPGSNPLWTKEQRLDA